MSKSNPSVSIEQLAFGGMREGNEVFWGLFDASWPMLERFAKIRISGKGIQESFTKDCVQEAFERVCRYRKSYQGTTEGEFWSWLGKICDNVRRTALRKEQRQPRLVTSAYGRDDMNVFDRSISANPASSMESEDAFRALESCMQRIDELGLSVIRLRYWPPQLSQRGAAELLGCSPAQVFKLEHRSLKSLLECLKVKGVEYDDNMSM